MNLKGCLGFLLPGIPSACTGQGSCPLCLPQQAGDNRGFLAARVPRSLPALPANAPRFASQLLSNGICNVFFLSGSTEFLSFAAPLLASDGGVWMDGMGCTSGRSLVSSTSCPRKEHFFFPLCQGKIKNNSFHESNPFQRHNLYLPYQDVQILPNSRLLQRIFTSL